jgi:hypothetical protein
MEASDAKMLETKKEETLQPPYGNVSWYVSFFELIRTRQFDVFDKERIELNIIKGSGAPPFFTGIRFLGLVEDNGKTTEKFESLRRTGDEFKQNLKTVVEEAYKDLFAKIVIDKAKPETLVNYFMERHQYSEATARLALKILVYLCQEAGIPISPELTAPPTPKLKAPGKPSEKRIEEKGRKQIQRALPEGMHESRWGDDVIICLKKGDRAAREKLAKTAKKLIDMYVEEEEA